MSFFRFLSLHAALGVAIGWTLLTGFLYVSWDGLGTLLTAEGPMPLVLLFAMFALTFASVAMGIGIMTLSDTGVDADDGPGPQAFERTPQRRAKAGEMIPIRLPVERQRRR
jgi:hypothetical protein